MKAVREKPYHIICLVLNKTFRKCNDKLPSFNTLPSCSACIQCYRMDYGMDKKSTR